jgi:uncharacterized protein YbjT (DUF2867 family)
VPEPAGQTGGFGQLDTGYVEAMDVVVVGGHGKIGMRLLRLLAARGDAARGVVRKPERVADLEQIGAQGIVFDLERDDDLAAAIGPADAIVFAAGAGPGSGPERKKTVDLGGAIASIEAAKANGISRFVIVSSIGAHDPPQTDEGMGPYLRAKHDADEAVIASGLDYTIVRPGHLTDDPGSGRIRVETEMGHTDSIPRDDVAATLAACLDELATVKRVFELFSGDEEIEAALRSLA